jgi:hypothetical protein
VEGDVVSAEGISLLPARITDIRAHPPPFNIRELQGSLGLFNFYGSFMKDAVAIIWPLADALKGGHSGTAAVTWTLALQSAFQRCSGQPVPP